MVVEHGGELHVGGGLAQRGGEPTLEIGTARPAFRDRVDVDDRVEIGAREPAQRGVTNGNGFHAISSSRRVCERQIAVGVVVEQILEQRQ